MFLYYRSSDDRGPLARHGAEANHAGGRLLHEPHLGLLQGKLSQVASACVRLVCVCVRASVCFISVYLSYIFSQHCLFHLGLGLSFRVVLFVFFFIHVFVHFLNFSLLFFFPFCSHFCVCIFFSCIFFRHVRSFVFKVIDWFFGFLLTLSTRSVSSHMKVMTFSFLLLQQNPTKGGAVRRNATAPVSPSSRGQANPHRGLHHRDLFLQAGAYGTHITRWATPGSSPHSRVPQLVQEKATRPPTPLVCVCVVVPSKTVPTSAQQFLIISDLLANPAGGTYRGHPEKGTRVLYSRTVVIFSGPQWRHLTPRIGRQNESPGYSLSGSRKLDQLSKARSGWSQNHTYFCNRVPYELRFWNALDQG